MNKQKFLAELSRLLGFMSSWDRADTIQKYSAIFDASDSEAEVIAELGSPTKLAISIARDYVPTARPERTDQAVCTDAEDAVPEEQVHQPMEQEGEKAAQAENGQDAQENAAAEDIAAAEMPSPSDDLPTDEEASESARSASGDALKNESAVFSKDTDIAPEMLSALESAIERAEKADVLSGGDAEESASEPELSADEPCENVAGKSSDGRKARPAVLILYVLLSVAIGLPIAVVLIAIGVPFALLGGGAAAGTVYGFIHMIPALTMFSDVLLVIGAGLVLIGAGLLVAWFGLWLSIKLGCAWIGGVIFRLGDRLCFKREVAGE